MHTFFISGNRFADIRNSNSWYQEFQLLIWANEFLVSTMYSRYHYLNSWYHQMIVDISTSVADIKNSNFWYEQFGINVNSACHTPLRWLSQHASAKHFDRGWLAGALQYTCTEFQANFSLSLNFQRRNVRHSPQDGRSWLHRSIYFRWRHLRMLIAEVCGYLVTIHAFDRQTDGQRDRQKSHR